MWIELLILCLLYCPQMDTFDLLSNCSFNTDLYYRRSAVQNQFQFINRTSLTLFASYAFQSLDIGFQLGLIYPYGTNEYLLPFPLMLNCASDVQSCQLKSINNPSSNAEWIRVQLNTINYTDDRTNQLWNQRSFFLRQGRYQLSNCSMNNGQFITDSQTIFSLEIHYEKSQGSSCNSLNEPCGISSLTKCISSTCQCISSSTSPISYFGNSFCADMINGSNCQIFPSRCLPWCNISTNPLCMCPSDTSKVQENSFYLCRYPLDASNCSIDDSLRRCARGQCCEQGRCLNCPLNVTITTSTSSSSSLMFNSSPNSFDERLRIALGVIAGLLGVSAVILFTILCWLHHRQHHIRHLQRQENSDSSTSSLYISPVVRHLSISTIEQEIDPNNGKFFRTDSFRHAVSADGTLIEHVSATRDSVLSDKESCASPNFSTLEFVMPIYQNLPPFIHQPESHRV